MTVRSAKCQAKNPNLCTDPRCPELREHAHRLSQAKNYDQYAVAAKAKYDIERQRGVHQMAQKTQTAPKRPISQEKTREGDPVIKFHRDLGFPKGYTPPSGTQEIVYSRHAKEEAQSDRYGVIPQMQRVNLDKMELIELKVNANTKKAYRFLYRAELDDENDICLVLQPVGRGKMMVITNWINNRKDKHKTLRRNEYAVPA